MSPWLVAVAVAVLVLAGSLLGAFLRTRLPRHHLDDDTKEMVKMGIGFLSTLAALVLGLIISSAKGSFDTKSAEVESAAVQLLQLNNNLKQLGDAGEPARALLRHLVTERVGEYWGKDRTASQGSDTNEAAQALYHLQKMLRAIPAANAGQHSAWSKALQLIDDLAQLRSVAIAHSGSSITPPLLALLVFWLMIIAVGLNLFAPSNGTIHAVNVLCALSVAGAIFLILEMDQPYEGLIRVSDAPLRAVLLQLEK